MPYGIVSELCPWPYLLPLGRFEGADSQSYSQVVQCYLAPFFRPALTWVGSSPPAAQRAKRAGMAATRVSLVLQLGQRLGSDLLFRAASTLRISR